GGKLDLYLMRAVDVMYAFPTLLFVILIMSALGAGLLNIFIAIGVTGWVTLCRLTRGQILALREQEFIIGAHAAGATSWQVIFRHLLPNALAPIIVAVTFGVPRAIFTEAALSFIGVGINPPLPSWGGMVGEYQTYLRSYWYMATFPAVAIGLTMLSFSFLGDGLRDALDPTQKR
ncbi:MAG TPA: ABC transporter permease, partial [bacterium]|nr:ABC transporter permease [bacterium]